MYYYEPKGSDLNTEDEDDDFDLSYMSPVLSSALIETPREQEVCQWSLSSKSRSSSRERIVPLDNETTDQFLRSRAYLQDKVGPLTPLDDGGCITPGGSKKAVKFSHAKILDPSDTFSDYFSASKMSCSRHNKLG